MKEDSGFLTDNPATLRPVHCDVELGDIQAYYNMNFEVEGWAKK